MSGEQKNQSSRATADSAGWPCRATGVTPDVQAIMQNFMDSMKDNPTFAGAQGEKYTTLPDLLPPATTLPAIGTLSRDRIDALLRQLPPTLLLHAVEGADEEFIKGASEEDALAFLDVLEIEQKQEILRKVLQSPQFSQSLASLTVALRDGGLPSISEALGIRLRDGGYIGTTSNGIAKGGGAAVRAFVEGYDVDEAPPETQSDAAGERMEE